MAAYLELYSKHKEPEPGQQAVPENFTEIDNAMCQHFGVEPDPDYFYRSWYDLIGFGLAVGRTYAELRELAPGYAPVIDWLEANYTVKAYYCPIK